MLIGGAAETELRPASVKISAGFGSRCRCGEKSEFLSISPGASMAQAAPSGWKQLLALLLWLHLARLAAATRAHHQISASGPSPPAAYHIKARMLPGSGFRLSALDFRV